ncbi:EamA family transporter [Candidatus Nanosalina sp. VS9-1]|uniref:DMT family transporter n=1 Tax=Candidatus Nanosalina sp. VS9-1 TaxID=3388566 RepID=UPI0039E1BE30
MDPGIMLALGVALIKGYQAIYQRRNALGTDEFITAWSSRAFGVPVLLAAILFYGVPDLGLQFFLMIVPQSLAIAAASILIAKAYKESDASIVTPMYAISPMLVLVTSFLILGEIPSVSGGIGVLCIALGAYALKIKGAKSVLEPVRKLWQERGVQLILVVLLIYSITANTDKIGVGLSSPVMWPLAVYSLSSIFLMPVMMRKSDDWKKQVKTEWRPLALLGVLGAVAIILQMTAINTTLVSYVISIKRLSIPLTVVFSYFMLDEKESFRERIIGSGLMVLGAILISI